RAMGPGFHDLEPIHNEIFPQARQTHGSRGALQVFQRPLKELGVGEDGERSSAGRFQFRRQFLRIELGPDQTARWRCLLQLRDYGGAVLAGRLQYALEPARDIRFRLLFEPGKIAGGPRLSEVSAGCGNDLIQARGHSWLERLYETAELEVCA